MSKLRALYQHLRAAAVQSGTDQRRDLPNGARLTVRVRDGVETVTFARRAAAVGITEEQTFARHCGVPSGAERIPATDQQIRRDERGWEWFLVAYRWRIEAEQPALFDDDREE